MMLLNDDQRKKQATLIINAYIGDKGSGPEASGFPEDRDSGLRSSLRDLMQAFQNNDTERAVEAFQNCMHYCKQDDLQGLG